MIKKVCTKCNRRKNIEEFTSAHGQKHGRRQCRECLRKSDLEHPEWRETHNNKRFIRLYGIDLQFFRNEAWAQGGKCFICQRSDRGLVPDHDHRTGRFRGVLCRSCNSALGMLGDCEDGVKRALLYLQAVKQRVQFSYFPEDDLYLEKNESQSSV